MLTVDPSRRFSITQVIQHLRPVMIAYKVTVSGLPPVPPLESPSAPDSPSSAPSVQAFSSDAAASLLFSRSAPKAASSKAAAAQAAAAAAAAAASAASATASSAAEFGFDDSAPWDPEFPPPNPASSPDDDDFDPFPQPPAASNAETTASARSPDGSPVHSSSSSSSVASAGSVLLPPAAAHSSSTVASSSSQPAPALPQQPATRPARSASLLLPPVGGLYSNNPASAVVAARRAKASSLDSVDEAAPVVAANSSALDLLLGASGEPGAANAASAKERSQVSLRSLPSATPPVSQPGAASGTSSLAADEHGFNDEPAEVHLAPESNFARFMRGITDLTDSSVGKWVRRCTEESLVYDSKYAKYLRHLIVASWEYAGLPGTFLLSSF